MGDFLRSVMPIGAGKMASWFGDQRMVYPLLICIWRVNLSLNAIDFVAGKSAIGWGLRGL